jgi:hypothetical protein
MLDLKDANCVATNDPRLKEAAVNGAAAARPVEHTAP